MLLDTSLTDGAPVRVTSAQAAVSAAAAALRPCVLCGPSGTGKSTLLKKLFNEFPDKFGFSVSREFAFRFPPESRWTDLSRKGDKC